MDIALIGCGFIGGLISEQIASGRLPFKLKLILDRNEDKVKRIQNLFEDPPVSVSNVSEITGSNVDLVIEAASIEAVRKFALPILSAGKNLVILSVGAFSRHDFQEKVRDVCRRNNSTVYIPSGAIGGLDAVSSAAANGLENVELTTIKNPRSFEGAPYILKHAINLNQIKSRTLLFEGNATDAVKGFPSNVNVALTLSLTGIGIEKTYVKIFADPETELNNHVVRAKGDFGELVVNVHNLPSPDNPRSSFLAALSAIAMLKKIVEPIKIG